MNKQLISVRAVDSPEAKNGWGFANYPHPFFHVYVAAENGYCWGCFGRGIIEAPEAKIVCQGYANLNWVMEIACLGCQVNPRPCLTGDKCSSSPCAGVNFKINGICHNCANRILLPAGIDVHDVPGNEIATFLFGKYGPGKPELVSRLKKAAERANEREPGAVTEADLENVLRELGDEEQGEYTIILQDLQEFLGVRLPDLDGTAQDCIAVAHRDLYAHRIRTFADYQNHAIGEQEYIAVMRKHAMQAFLTISKELGCDNFIAAFGMPPEAAAKYAFA